MRFLLLVASILALPRSAGAEINMADSIEWTTADSDRVVLGKVAKVDSRTDPAGTWYVATLTVAETLKGPAARTIEIVVRGGSGDNHPATWKRTGEDVLLFLVASPRRAAQDGGTDAPTRYRVAPFALHHGRQGDDAYRVDHGAVAYALDHAVLRTRAELVAKVRAAAGSRATSAFQLDLPLDSPAGRALYGGSAVFLYVPIDATLEAIAIGWLGSTEPRTREQGVTALAHFRSPANARRLEALLADPATHDVTEGDRPTVRRYFVRKRAHEVLRGWGVPHATPPIDVAPAP